MTIYIGLSTLEYLKKGGRVSSMTALAADVLNIKPVMHFSTGTLDTYQKCRGMKKSRKVMIDAMKHELETNFREEYAAGKVYLMAASSSTDEATEEWVSQIKENFREWKSCVTNFLSVFHVTLDRMDLVSDAPVSRCKVKKFTRLPTQAAADRFPVHV